MEAGWEQLAAVSSKPPAILHVHPGAFDLGHIIYPSQPLKLPYLGKREYPGHPNRSWEAMCRAGGPLALAPILVENNPLRPSHEAPSLLG